MDKTVLYKLVTASTAAEGSTLSLQENVRLLRDGVSSEGKTIAEQLMNLDLLKGYEAAVEDASSHQIWSAYRIKLLAAKALRNFGFDCSRIRSEAALQKICQEANEARMHARTLKSEGLYNVSYSIHFRVSDAELWPEGNDLMARLLMNMLQLEFGLEPISIREPEEYATLLRSAVREDIEDVFTSHAKEVMAPVSKCRFPQVKEATVKNSARILQILTEHPRYTTADLAEILQISAKGVEKHLANLKKSGSLQRIGPDKGGWWKVVRN
ncbi:MAG: winged helix-turn-helix transcriptional regulator [Bacteroidales bacterium]|nr:winged helix-turn-helix transcriptional regulator [Bacteroidales bacterium]